MHVIGNGTVNKLDRRKVPLVRIDPPTQRRNRRTLITRATRTTTLDPPDLLMINNLAKTSRHPLRKPPHLLSRNPTSPRNSERTESLQRRNGNADWTTNSVCSAEEL